jgi:hypothetical protein
LAILTTVTLVSLNNALPDDGDCTETCRSCFNANFNVNFKTVFKTIQLCISWWVKNFDNIKMQKGTAVKINLKRLYFVGLQYITSQHVFDYCWRKEISVLVFSIILKCM